MLRMRVKALTHHPDQQAATLVLEDLGGSVVLGLVVPMNEANRLARVAGLTACQWAPIYELFHDVVAELGARVSRTVLDHEPDGVCATLVLERDGGTISVPCHPADAIALALRTHAPVYATPSALSRGCRLEQPEARVPGGEATARWLERVRPQDFRSRADEER